MKNVTIAYLLHGRHLQCNDWEGLLLGEPPNRLGSFPRLVLEILRNGLYHLDCITFGTGGSEKDGLKESEYTKHFCLENINQLNHFPILASERSFDLGRITELIAEVICDTRSQNTAEEVALASALFANRSVTRVFQVTNGSHAPRCLLEASKGKAAGVIPVDQAWYVVPDDMTFAGTTLTDVKVVEPPHRGDDPMAGAAVQTYELVSMLDGYPPEKRKELLSLFAQQLRQ